MKQSFLCLLLLMHVCLHAQDVRVQAHATCNGRHIQESDTLPGGIIPETVRFYLTGFQFFRNGREVFREENSYHLVDREGTWTITVPEYDEIAFNLGTDSLVNVSGALGGDLDPTKGMYWTWNSGYINVKLEGISPMSKGRNNGFGLHLGGYMPPFQTVYLVKSPATATGGIRIELDVCPMLEKVDWQQHYNVMSPSAEAVRLAKLLGQSIRVYAE